MLARQLVDLKRSANGSRVHTRATMAILLSRGTPQVLQVYSYYCANNSPPVSMGINWCVFYRTWSLFLMSATHSSIVHCSFVFPSSDLTLTLDLIAISPSPMSPSLKQAPPVVPMLSIAKATMHIHMHLLIFVPTCQLLAAKCRASLIGFRHIPMAP